MSRRSGRWMGGVSAAGVLVAFVTALPVPSASPAAEAALPGLAASRAPVAVHASVQVPDTVFRHADHRGVDCLACHSMDPAHGEVRVRSLADCRACHHAPPLARDCAACHSRSDAPGETYRLERTPDLSVGAPPPRLLPFRHADHPDVACGSCHTEGLALSAREVSCAACHQDHHRPEARCATCHMSVLDVPHTVDVHVGCGGAGCHQELPFEGVPRTRDACVACHQDMELHRPGPACATCHLLPPPRTGGAGG